MKVLVTGSSGFIGHAVCHALLDRGDTVIGLDNHNAYYDVSLKEARRANLLVRNGFQDYLGGLEDTELVEQIFTEHQPERVINLAAQAGVRYSIDNPRAYTQSNLVGFTNILEACRHHQVSHLVYASSSSVYGANTEMPFSVDQPTNQPVSLYAATKKANELMAHAYSRLYETPMTGLRFFTVYGPWGRPDMAPFKFLRAILAGEPIDLYNHGDHSRDFTYIDDIVAGVLAVLDKPPTSTPPDCIHNIGRGEPVHIGNFIGLIERETGMTAQKNLLPMQMGDVKNTWADVLDLQGRVDYRPSTTVETGVNNFVRWYREFYQV
ncbi:NAD-dependent epimerase/dehydratase family protein [Spongiibacter sp. KMU-158]|uniref:NAD-dependent epimerase/dehydratase family protein n=1 Tax=Spongiibacter pelagi TaxID=2760804 RepID=A0A927C2Z9_9GAMM|nr:NAD-dependent epimerase/dehydratase family protein [Spongiibacter pelagi]MBD2858535.1 NAD-dependent epimerase/dehydratase family protein [Spongiibacter pelagi]